MTSRLIIGDALTELRKLPAESVHCCITSPPYWGLRDYGVDGQLGHESTPDQHVETMVRIFREVRRVLKPSGTLWLNYGDTFTGSDRGGIGGRSTLDGSSDAQEESRAGQRRMVESRRRDRARVPKNTIGVAGLPRKSLVGMPWRIALGLQADGWLLRRDIIWHKPTAMPESCRDRPTTAHEYVFLFSRGPRYHYDAEAIAEPCTGRAHARGAGVNPKARVPSGWDQTTGDHRKRTGRYARPRQNESFAGSVVDVVKVRNRRSVWTIPSQPFKGAHFATFPPDLIRPCVRAGCARGGVVLDPFFGSGTTGLVCDEEGRGWIGIELNPEYARIAQRRLAEKQELLA